MDLAETNNETKQIKASEMTLGEICELEKAIDAGDLQARQMLDDAARADGYIDYDDFMRDLREAMQTICAPVLDDPARALREAMQTICAPVLDDPAVKMILARLNQPEVVNDPVLGLWAQLVRNEPLFKMIKDIKARMGHPIVISPAPMMQAQSPDAIPTKPARTVAQATDKLDYLESKILQAYHDLEKEDLSPTDERIAARLPESRKGQPYTRETVNRKRQAMRGRDIQV
jgi:hypothetical protein